MAKKRSIRIGMSAQRVEALQEICDEALDEFVPDNEHQLLLKEYLHELHSKLQEMLKRQQQTYQLILFGPEAIAFYQLWHMLDISRDKYANLIVDNLLKKISSLAA
jgi:hypothetical protein